MREVATYDPPMGIKKFLTDRPVASFGLFLLYGDRIRYMQAGKEGQPLLGVEAVVESGEALQKRVTLTRLVGLGVFAFAAKKKSGGESYLLIEGPDFAWSFEVKRGEQGAARAFAAAVNNQVRAVS